MINSTIVKYIFHRYNNQILLVVLLSVIANILMLVPTLYMLQIYDRILISQSELTLLVISLISFGLLISMSAAEWLRSRILNIISEEINNKYSNRIFNHIFSEKLKHSIQGAIQPFSDLSSLKQIISGPSVQALLDAPWTPIYVLVMFLMHPLLGWISLLFLISMSAVAWLTAKKINQYKDQSQEEEKESNSFIYNKFRNAEIIEAHGMTERLRDKWWIKQKNLLMSSIEAESVETVMTTISKEIAILKQSLALGVGAFLVIRGELSVGSMIAANLLMSRTTAPVDALISSWKSFQQGLMALKQIEEIIKIDDNTNLVKPKNFNADLKINNLNIHFQGQENYTIKNLNLHIPSGQKVALIGDSGSGKSTIIKSIIGLIEIQKGEIRWDDALINNFDKIHIGKKVGYLSQKVGLFDGTIADNIARFGSIDSNKIIEASRIVGMHEIILRLPDGYNTKISGKSDALSAGQKQRLALARAMYDYPKLLILDEPDSNLDEIGEQALELTLNSKSHKPTIVLVSHKEKLLKHVDRIITIVNGQIDRDEYIKN